MSTLEFKRLTAPVDLKACLSKLSPERRHVADAMKLYARLSRLLTEAVAERDQNAYRRLCRVCNRAAYRLERRSMAIGGRARLPLGNIHKKPAMPRPQQPATISALATAA